MNTLVDLFNASVARRGEAPALRGKESGTWRATSYRELGRRAGKVTEFLIRHGIRPGDRVALFRENHPEWAEIFFGIAAAGATAVPVDARLPEGDVAHILRDSGARFAFADGRRCPALREVEAALDSLEAVAVKDLGRAGPVATRRPVYLDYDRAMTEASSDGSGRGPPSERDVAALIYTSGTTGRQKGAMLTHGNLSANVESCRRAIDILETDNFLLVLPLHHSFALTTNLLLPVAVGAEISFVESLRTVGENLREISPTVVCGVPLLFEKMHNRIRNALDSNRLARALYAAGLSGPVRRRIRRSLGGRLRMLVTGGAPCDPEVLRGFDRLGIPVIEGYGLTEAGPVLTLNPPDRPKPGTVGRALPGVQIAILDPNAEGAGEIAARGANVMEGYFNDESATAEVIRDGWLLTGDLGVLDAEGYLSITGRKKSLIINREGRNIHPEEVERQLLKSPFVAEALAVGYREPGEKVGERVGAIVVPRQDALDQWAERRRRAPDDREIGERIRAEVRAVSAELAEYKRPRRIQIRMEPFEKTTTGKIKRYLYALDALPVDE